MSAPQGPPPNVVIPGIPSLFTTAAVVVSVILPLCSLVAIAFRFKARRHARQDFGADDWWMVVAWVFGLALSILVWIFGSIVGIEYLKVPPLYGVTKSLEGIVIISFMDQFPLVSVKVAILLFYKRIFTRKWFEITCYTMIGLVISWGIILSVLFITQGDPVTAAWTGQGRLRYNSVALSEAQVATSIVLDFIILCLPAPIIFTLQIPLRKKIAVISIFWLGLFCCIAPIVRLVYFTHSLKELVQNFGSIAKQDVQIIWVFIEYNTAIVAGCLPVYGPLVHGRSTESMFRSLRSMFSISSRSRSTLNESKSMGTRNKDYTDLEMLNTDHSGSETHVGREYTGPGIVKESHIQVSSVSR